MMRVISSCDGISIHGHAENKIVCGMVTALSISMLNGLMDYLGEQPDTATLEMGELELHGVSKLSDNAKLLFEVFRNSIEDLMIDYPNSFENIIRNP